VLTPIICRYLDRYPSVQVILKLDDRFIDPASCGADLTVRIGHLVDSSLFSRKLGEVQRVTVASPSYLLAHGVPRKPRDLRDHDCIIWQGDHDGAHWTFTSSKTGPEAVPIRGRFKTDSVPAAIEAVRQGLGIGLLSYWQVQDWIERNELICVLQDFQPPARPIHALWAPKTLPTRTRLLLEEISKSLSGRLL